MFHSPLSARDLFFFFFGREQQHCPPHTLFESYCPVWASRVYALLYGFKRARGPTTVEKGALTSWKGRAGHTQEAGATLNMSSRQTFARNLRPRAVDGISRRRHLVVGADQRPEVSARTTKQV